MKKYAILLGTILLGLASALSYAQAPVPFINLPLVPDATPPGGPEFTLTVNGTGFVSNSVVNWNGVPLATQFVSQGQLTATVPAANIATASTANLTVVSPPPGGGTSNVAFFAVTASTGKLGFSLAQSPTTGISPVSVAVGDFNGDGRLDLAVANACGSDPACASQGAVSILLGDGTGVFTLASSPATGWSPISVAVGDFNGDGKLDVAVLNSCGNDPTCSSGTVSILLGDGTGNFTLSSSPAVGPHPRAVAAGDFNGDGKLDLAVTNGICAYCPGSVSVLLGDGKGNFVLASSPTVGFFPYSVAVGDFNGDGKLDLVVANYCGGDWTCQSEGTVSVLLGDGTGNFSLASSPVAGLAPDAVAIGDFNGGGNLDLAVADFGANPYYTSNLSILLGEGTGNFTGVSSPGVGGCPDSVAAGDFNGDDKLDLAVANQCSGTLSVLLGDGTGNFAPVPTPLPPSGGMWSVAVGDFNGDGRLDLAAVSPGSDTVSILLAAIPPVLLDLTEASFGTTLVGTSSSAQPVTLANIGAGTLNITSIAASANFIQRNNCGSSLAAGAHCTISVGFRPVGVGTLTGTITITDNAPNSPQTVSLSGVGTAVTLLPSSVAFGDQLVGTTSAPQTVTFTNYVNHGLTIQGIRIAGGAAGSFAQSNTCVNNIPTGGDCTISVTFTPKSTGAKNGTLEVYDNGGASPQTVALSGNGT